MEKKITVSKNFKNYKLTIQMKVDCKSERTKCSIWLKSQILMITTIDTCYFFLLNYRNGSTVYHSLALEPKQNQTS